jgi:hypothetical protein
MCSYDHHFKVEFHIRTWLPTRQATVNSDFSHPKETIILDRTMLTYSDLDLTWKIASEPFDTRIGET